MEILKGFFFFFASIVQVGFIEKLKFHLNLKRYDGLSTAISGKRKFQAEEECLTCLEKSKEGKIEGGGTKRKGSRMGHRTLWGLVGHF